MKFDLQHIVEDRTTFNVIAETKQGRDDNVVMLGAHLDSVRKARASTTTAPAPPTILEIAVQLAKSTS